MTTKLEQLAGEIAFLSNADMHALATILVQSYPTRADILETQISTSFFDTKLPVGTYHYE